MRTSGNNRAGIQGFTLIELMIVVVVIAILAAIAYPAYQDQVRKSRRTEAKSALQEMMNRQERFYTTNNLYTIDLDGDLNYDADPFITEEGWYSIAAAACGGGLNQCVSLTATALNDQDNDQCEDFTLTSQGLRTVSGSGDCW